MRNLNQQQASLLKDAYEKNATCLLILSEQVSWLVDDRAVAVTHTSTRFLYADIEDLIQRGWWLTSAGDSTIYFSPLAWQIGAWLNGVGHDQSQ